MKQSLIDDGAVFLQESGLYDLAWIELLAGTQFEDVPSALRHFVAHQVQNNASPHPFLDPSVWPGHLQVAWRRAEVRSVLRYFRKPLSEQPSLNSFVLTRETAFPNSGVLTHGGGSAGWLIHVAPDDFEVMTGAGPRIMGQIRRTWQPMAREFRRQSHLVRNRLTRSWNSAAEDSWRAGLLPIPDGVGVDGPLVTVIMPAWNRADVIAAAIRSVQEQTLSQWELLVVDDGSTDSTPAVVSLFAERDPRIRLIETEHAGVSAARNLGMSVAKGDYFAFLDTDNAWLPDYLELMVRGMSQRRLVAAYAGLELRTGGLIEYRAFEGGRDDLRTFNHIDLNILVVDADLARQVGFDPALRRWVDHDFALRIADRSVPVLFPFIGCIYDNNRESGKRISTTESESWQWAVLGKNLVTWDAHRPKHRVAGRVSVIIPIYQDVLLTLKAVRAVQSNSGHADVEIILIDNGSALTVSAALCQALSGAPGIQYIRLPRNMNFAIGSNIGATKATGEFVCFLNNDTEVRSGWLEPLLERISEPDVLGVQPLLLFPDDTIQSAGSVFLGRNSIPAAFLAGLQPEDAEHVGAEEFTAVTAACLLMRWAVVQQLAGFDPIFVNGMEDVDLCLRARDELTGHFVVEPRSRVTHHEAKTPGRGLSIGENRSIWYDRWKGRIVSSSPDLYRRAGFRIAGVGTDGFYVPSPRPVVVRESSNETRRWGIRSSAPGGIVGDVWGDTFYGDSLAAFLKVQGQKVVSYRHLAHNAYGSAFDDVNLVLRGLDEAHPLPKAVNVLWVISHPDQVTVQEVRAFDLVFAASERWATEMSKDSGREVKVLHQATDTRLFHPGPTQNERAVTFVGGNFHHRTRRVVQDAVRSGVPLRVTGHGWSELPPGILQSEHVSNSELGQVYRDSSVVLADHWTEMAKLGFLQNRLFDAAACGVPVISDEVHGLRDVFGSIVQTYENLDELRYLCSPEGRVQFGSEDEILEQARRIGADHSFDARARTLISAVEEIESVKLSTRLA